MAGTNQQGSTDQVQLGLASAGYPRKLQVCLPKRDHARQAEAMSYLPKLPLIKAFVSLGVFVSAAWKSAIGEVKFCLSELGPRSSDRLRKCTKAAADCQVPGSATVCGPLRALKPRDNEGPHPRAALQWDGLVLVAESAFVVRHAKRLHFHDLGSISNRVLSGPPLFRKLVLPETAAVPYLDACPHEV